MKKIYLTSAGLVLSGILVAQPTLTDTNNAPEIGETFVVSSVDWDGADPLSGADQTWDYSSLTAGGSVTTEYLELEDCDGYESFPAATIGLTSDGSNYGFNEITASGVFNHGYYASGIEMIYSDPEQQMVYPLNYEDTFTDEFACEFVSGGYDFERSGSSTITAVGYGTLELPFGTVENVLLVKLVQDYMDELIEFGVETNYETTVYQFFVPGYHYPILGFSEIIVDGGDPIRNGQLTADESVNIVENKAFEVEVYPNPTNNILNISMDQNKSASITSVEVLDLSGKVIVSNLAYTDQINTSALENGVYFLRIGNADGETVIRKFIRE